MRRSVFALLLLLATPAASAQTISLSLAAIEHPLFAARNVRLHLSAIGSGPAKLTLSALRIGERRFARALARCPTLDWRGDHVDCPRGELVVAGAAPLPFAFSYSTRTESLTLTLQPTPGERWQLWANLGRREAELRLENAALARLGQWLPALAQYKFSGKTSGRVAFSAASLRGRVAAHIEVADLSFGDASGTRAGEKIATTLSLTARQSGVHWAWQAKAEWTRGAVFYQPFYFAQGGFRIDAEGMVDSDALRVDRGRLELAGIGGADFRAELQRSPLSLRSASVETSEIDLARAAPVLLAPVLEQRGLPKFDFSGRGRLSASIMAGNLASADLRLTDASISEARGRFAARGIDADIPWRRDAATQTDIRVGGGSFGRMPLGAFSLPLSMKGLSFDLPQARIPLLDGLLLLKGLHAEHRGDEWRWQFGGALQPVSMTKLTDALGLPRMSGVLSADVPTITYSASTVRLDGALIIQVFDGFLAATDLRIIEPFGRVPRLLADIEMRHVDLGQLTETFSFGSITGFIDGDIRGLELADWRPARFDARIASSPGDYRKRISQRAVQNISSLGGAGAAAAIQRSFLRFFDEFGYSKLGLSCVMRNGVCEMGGVESASNGYVIVKGGGVPAINVLGYNRNVDWDELLARLKRVTEGNMRPVIQ